MNLMLIFANNPSISLMLACILIICAFSGVATFCFFITFFIKEKKKEINIAVSAKGLVQNIIGIFCCVSFIFSAIVLFYVLPSSEVSNSALKEKIEYYESGVYVDSIKQSCFDSLNLEKKKPNFEETDIDKYLSRQQRHKLDVDRKMRGVDVYSLQ